MILDMTSDPLSDLPARGRWMFKRKLDGLHGSEFVKSMIDIIR